MILEACAFGWSEKYFFFNVIIPSVQKIAKLCRTVFVMLPPKSSLLPQANGHIKIN